MISRPVDRARPMIRMALPLMLDGSGVSEMALASATASSASSVSTPWRDAMYQPRYVQLIGDVIEMLVLRSVVRGTWKTNGSLAEVV